MKQEELNRRLAEADRKILAIRKLTKELLKLKETLHGEKRGKHTRRSH